MIRVQQQQAPLGAALLKGRTLTHFPDDLAPFGAVVETEPGDVGELLAWLGPQIVGPDEEDPCFEEAKAFENERFAAIFVISELKDGVQVPLWPRVRFVYAPESRVKFVAPPQPRPIFAFYFAVQTVGGTLAGMDQQLLEGIGLQPPRPN